MRISTARLIDSMKRLKSCYEQLSISSLSDEDRNELSEMLNEVRKRMTEIDDKCKKWEEEHKNFPIS